MATRRHFTQEYKNQTVSLVVNSDRAIAELARTIGAHEMTLGKWVKKAGRDAEALLSSDERAEPGKLRSEVPYLRLELEFAKK